MLEWLAQEVPSTTAEWMFYGGGLGALALLVWLLATAKIVPRSTLVDERAQHAAEIKIRDETIERLIGERNEFVELAVRSARAAEATTSALADPNIERVAMAAAEEALRRVGKTG